MRQHQVGTLVPDTLFLRDVLSHLEQTGFDLIPLDDLESTQDPGVPPPGLFLIDGSYIPATPTHLHTDIPILIMEANGRFPLTSDGMIQTIRKPFAPEKLMEHIGNILRKRRVLIVDDTPSFRKMVAAEFPEEDFEIQFGTNGMEGYRAARTFKPDLITMDVEMPEMDGYKACELIRNDPETDRIPIVFVTTLGQVDDMERGFRSGAVEYFVKPFQSGHLHTFAKRLLARLESRKTSDLAVLGRRNATVQILEYVLLKNGFNVATGTSIPELKQSMDSREPELLLVNMDDAETPLEEQFSDLRLYWPDCPVVTVTEEDRKTTIIRALKAGAVDYLAAPFVEEELVRRVETHLRLHHALQQLQEANRQLRELSVTDALTGLFNRGFFTQSLKAEIKKLSRRNDWLSCIMIDIDHFKQVNDRFGHLAGDTILTQLAAILKELPRETDLAARYGGEEFVLLLPQTDIEGARTLAERIRNRVEATSFEHGDLTIPITISCGVHGIQNFLEGPNLLKYADEALYHAKESGRNRTTCHEQI